MWRLRFYFGGTVIAPQFDGNWPRNSNTDKNRDVQPRENNKENNRNKHMFWSFDYSHFDSKRFIHAFQIVYLTYVNTLLLTRFAQVIGFFFFLSSLSTVTNVRIMQFDLMVIIVGCRKKEHDNTKEITWSILDILHHEITSFTRSSLIPPSQNTNVFKRYIFLI